MLEEILDALIGSEPFERLLASRERPLVARAPAGADFVLAATARALESPILAVASGPQDVRIAVDSGSNARTISVGSGQ